MTTATEPRSGRLAHLGVLRFTGPDSISFLQGQVSNDTRRLTDGIPLLAAYSSPQGRVLAVMHLLPHSTGVAAILPRELVVPTLERLRKFVLRAKVKIEDASEVLGVSGQYGVGQSSTGYTEKDGVGVAAVNGDRSRHWVIGAAETLAEQAPADEHYWRLADIRAGLPQIYLATCETFVARSEERR